MRINEIAILPLIRADSGLRFLLAAEAAPEFLRQLCFDSIGHLIASRFAESLHIAPYFFIVLSGEVKQQPLQIAGHQNVHGGRRGLIEGPPPVVYTGGDELRQHIVGVAGAHQPPHRQTHALGEIPCQNISEVAGRHHEVDLLPHPDAPRLHQIGIGPEVVYHLRGQPPDVDGVGGG